MESKTIFLNQNFSTTNTSYKTTSSTTVNKCGYFTDNYNTYYLDEIPNKK